VDNTAAGSNNGTSWANAWQGVSAIGGLSAGDIVYFSGGATASSHTYTVPSTGWGPQGGSAGNPITYSVGQDAAHNGMVIFLQGTTGNEFLIKNPASYITFTGYYGQVYDPMTNTPVPGVGASSAQHMQFGNGADHWDDNVYCNILGSSNHLSFSYIYSPSAKGGFLTLTNVLNNNFTASQIGLNIDHCYLYKSYAGNPTTGPNAMLFYLAGSSMGNTWNDAQLTIHHNFLTVTGSTLTDNDGDKVSQYAGGGYSFYNNHVHRVLNSAYTAAYGTGQHSDFWQCNSNYVKIYNNWFDNVEQSVWFHESTSGSQTYSYFLFFNNIITQQLDYSLCPATRGFFQTRERWQR
jgi:hypothetical protein